MTLCEVHQCTVYVSLHLFACSAKQKFSELAADCDFSYFLMQSETDSTEEILKAFRLLADDATGPLSSRTRTCVATEFGEHLTH